MSLKPSRYILLLFLLFLWLPALQAEDPELAGIPVADTLESEPLPVLLPILRKPFSAEVYNFSGDQQSQNIGLKTEKTVIAQVVMPDGSPVPSFPVFFEVLSTPEKGKNFSLSDKVVYTDSLGFARVYPTIGSGEGEYQFTARIIAGTEQSILVYRVFGRKSNWVIMLIVGLIGGLAMFLYGMEVMSNGLLRAAGDKMRAILSGITRNRVVALGMGAIVTMIIQSSNATAVMLVSFVNSRLMRFPQTFAIIMGATIGTTITSQLIAFRLTDYSLLLLGIGFMMVSFSRDQKTKNAGDILLGFGLLFFGMYVMSEAMYPLRSYEPFVQLLLKLRNPLLGILVGTVFTALIQSGSAFVGILIIFGSQGLISLEAVIPLLFGANLGAAVTALLASIKTSREAKKVAIAATLYKVAGIFLFIWWIEPFSKFIGAVSPGSLADSDSALQMAEILPRQIANAHTFYNLIVAAVFLPFSQWFIRLVDWIMPVQEEKAPKPLQTRYIDEGMLKTPALALSLAKLETLRMGLHVKAMVSDILPIFIFKRKESLESIEKKEKQVNFLRDAINSYLLKITRGTIREERVNEAFQMLYTIKEFEQIADIISGVLSKKGHYWINSPYEFSEEGKKEIADYHVKIMKQIDRAIVVFRELNLEKAREMKLKYKEYRAISFELEKQHFERLKDSVEKTVQSSNTHLELLSMMRSITGHSTNIARILIDWSGGKNNSEDQNEQNSKE